MACCIRRVLTFDIVTERTFDKAHQVINVGENKFQSVHQFAHLLLEDVWAIAQSHRDH